MRLLYLFCILSFTFLSCKTSFRISVINPAQVRLPEGLTKVGVVNNVNDRNSPEKILGNVITGQMNGNVMAAERAVAGVLRAIEDSEYLSGEMIEGEHALRAENGEINWEYLEQIKTDRGIEVIVEMSELRTTSPVAQTAVSAATGQRTERIEGNLDFNYYIIPTREKHENYWINRSYRIPVNQGQNIAIILNDIRRKQEHYRALGFNLGYGGGRLIYNHWVWVNRQYFNKGSGNLRRAKRMIRFGNWDIAEQQLLPDFDHRSRKVRGRTLYNLALIKEGQGDIDAAISYAEKASITLGNKLSNEYLQTLRQRKLQMAQL